MVNRIKKLREAKGWSAERLAEEVIPPTTRQTITRLETGKRGLDTKWMDRISIALGCDPADLLRSALPLTPTPSPSPEPPSAHPPSTGGTLAQKIAAVIADHVAGGGESPSPDDLSRMVAEAALLKEIGGRLKITRLALDISLEAICVMIGVPQEKWEQWEMGLAPPDSMALLNLSRQFGITANYILEGESIDLPRSISSKS